jgi:hypothetical protein
MNDRGIAPGKAWKRKSDRERVKPLDGVQLVKIQSGQRRSGQAGSESCACAGRLAGRGVDSKRAGRNYGRPTNYRGLVRLYWVVWRLWHKWLNRRTPGKTLDGAASRSCSSAIRFFPRASRMPRPGRGVLGEEPNAVIPHVQVCEGAPATMDTLHGHAAGNGGYGQGYTYGSGGSSPTRSKTLGLCRLRDGFRGALRPADMVERAKLCPCRPY